MLCNPATKLTVIFATRLYNLLNWISCTLLGSKEIFLSTLYISKVLGDYHK